jgi:heme/copper-type cytochrome/quinol oxidase subunit 2
MINFTSQIKRLFLASMAISLLLVSLPLKAETHLIELLADSYRIAGQKNPEITVKAGEPVLLRVTARKAKTMNRDGSIHSFTLLRAKDRTRVEGWDLMLKPGTQEFHLTAPAEPGEYVVLCTVICSDDHESMHMKFTVIP